MNALSNERNYLRYISLAVLFILVLLTYSNRVDDLDFWWHLRSGQVALQNLSYPQKDVFSYTTENTKALTDGELGEAGITVRPSSFPYWGVNLRHSWLGQVLFYLVYAGAGFPGIGIFKAVVFILCFSVLYWAMRRKGAGTLSSLLTLFLIVVIGQDFNFSRPQIFTFFFLSVLFALFVDFKKGGRKLLFLPACFLVWENLHGGFVIGAILMLIFWCSETGKYLLAKKIKYFERTASDRNSIRRLSYAGLFSVLIMLANPNGYKIFLVPFAIRKSLFSGIEEYAKPMLYEYHAYWFMLALVVMLFVLLFKFNDITDLLLVSFLLVTSQVGIRGIILFALGAGPFMAASLTSCWDWLRQRRFTETIIDSSALRRLIRYQPANVLFLLFLLYFSINNAQARGVLNFSINEDSYPAKAVTFLQDKNYPGRLFNPYNWGGYLIWKYPERQVFIDGRCLDEDAFFQHQIVFNALGGRSSSAATPLWKKLLDAYQVQVVLSNAITTDGKLVQLVDKLSIDPDWALVYQDGTALAFLRNSPENRTLYGQDFLPKIPRIYDEIVSECQKGMAKNPATWNYYKLLGSIYLVRRELGDARKMFEKYLSMNPNDNDVIQKVNLIRSFSGEAPIATKQNSGSYHHNW